MSEDRFTLRAAVYLILVKDGKTLLSRRFNTAWMNGHYSLIAGHLDGNESVFDCMIREANEEAGIKIEKKNLKPLTVIHRPSSSGQEYIDFFFIAEKWEGEPKIMETDKCDDMNWFPINNLPENTIPHVKKVIESYKEIPAFMAVDWN